jgi:alkylhydroperoxidase family enzyme
MDEAMVAKLDNYESSDLPESHKLAIRFIESWIQEKAQSVDDEFLLKLRRCFTPAEIIELTALAGIYESVHKFNHLFEMEVPEKVVEFDEAKVPARLSAYVTELQAKRGNAKR